MKCNAEAEKTSDMNDDRENSKNSKADRKIQHSSISQIVHTYNRLDQVQLIFQSTLFNSWTRTEPLQKILWGDKTFLPLRFNPFVL